MYVVVDKEQLESDLTIIADAIREKSGTNESLDFPHGMENAVKSIQIGDTENYNILDDMISLGYAFRHQKLNVETFDICIGKNRTDSSNETRSNFYALFENTRGVKHIKLNTLANVNDVSLSYAFNYSGSTYTDSLERVTLGFSDRLPISNFSDAFYGRKKLKEIVGTLSFTSSSSFGSAFKNCSDLEEIRFSQETIKSNVSFAESKLLSDESIASIVNGLYYNTSSSSKKITLSTTVISKLTDEQLNLLAEKNWTVG